MSTKVLLIDDSELFVETLALRLQTRGMTVSTAISAKEALRKIDEESYDAVILDLMMPEMDGLELLIILKQRRPELPVIVFTADVTSKRVKEAIRLGAFHFIPKITDLRILTRVIEEAKTGESGDRKKSAKSREDSER